MNRRAFNNRRGVGTQRMEEVSHHMPTYYSKICQHTIQKYAKYYSKICQHTIQKYANILF